MSVIGVEPPPAGGSKVELNGLRSLDALFRSAFEHTHVAMVLTDLGHRFVKANEAFARLFGHDPADVLRFTMADVTHPDDLAESYARREPLLAAAGDFFQMEKRYLHKDGRVFWGLTNVSLIRDDAGRPLFYLGQVQDVTERKRLEDQVRQAQKMEAIGRLAGGVAHDFNNLLSVILGYGELLLHDTPAGDARRPFVQEVVRAGERATALTRQLLAFSHKQVLVPVVLDLNRLVGEMEKMLGRLIGPGVALRFVGAPDVGRVRVDPGQIEQVVMNLVVNARDAMPAGGTVTMETANVDLDDGYAAAHLGLEPGPYVRLAVSDTGCGMDAATMAQVFEPFFTTKGPDKGTGLGLSIVYGIVKQSGGRVEAYSEVGIGTTFKVYLPRVADPLTDARPRPPAAAIRRGSETMLLVEDEDGVRRLTRLVLESCGYRVLECADGDEAVRTCERHAGPIAALVTDLVLPGVSGPALADRLRAVRPDLRVLFVSGYTDDAVIRHGMVTPDTPFLQKPFTADALAIKVRQLLDG